MSTVDWRSQRFEFQPVGVPKTAATPATAVADKSQPANPSDQVTLQPSSPLPSEPASTAQPTLPPTTSSLSSPPVEKTQVRTGAEPPARLQMDELSGSSGEATPLSLPGWSNTRQEVFFNPLCEITPQKMGPLGDFFTLPAGSDLSSRKPAIREWAQDRKAFVSGYQAAMGDKKADGTANDPVQALRELEQKWMGSEAKATPEMRTMLMEGFKGKGAFADVVRVYEESVKQDKDFKKYEIPCEYYIVALNKTKQTMRAIGESQSFVQSRLRQLSPTATPSQKHQACRDSGLNGEIFAGLGRAFKDIHSAAQKEIGKRIDQSGLSRLLTDLSGTGPAQWPGLGERASAATSKATQDKVLSLLKKPGAEAEVTKFLETQSGKSADHWTQTGPEFCQQFVQSSPEDRSQLLSSTVGLPVDQWSARQQKLTDLAQGAVRPCVEGFLSGGKTAAQAAEELSVVTGGGLKGGIPLGVVAQKLEDVRQDLTQNGGLDSEMAKVLSDTTGTRVGPDLLAASRKAMEVSRDYYMDGFAIDFEYYPGVNAVYSNLFLGNNLEAERLAPMVLSSCQREAGRTTKDYWNLATQVELGLIMNKPASLTDSLPRTLANAKADWELSTTVDSIEKLSQMRKNSGGDTQLLDYVGTKFRERMAVGFPPTDPNWNEQEFVRQIQSELEAMPGVKVAAPVVLDPERVKITDALLAKSTHFCEVFNSKFVGGNVPFGGQVADIPINRTDLRAVRHVIRDLGLNKTSDYATFNQKVDDYVEGRFGLVDRQTGKRVLEDLQSEEHHVMDLFSSERHNLTESRTSGASKTNLGVELALGTGDCRHTAISKQAIFDVWKRDHQSGHLERALEAAESGDLTKYGKEMKAVKEWDKLQLVTFTMTFHTPIDLHKDEQGKHQKYRLVLDDQSRPVKTPDGQSLAVEDHTFNALARFDDQGLVLPFEQGGLVTQDVFYKDFYPLANHRLDPRDILKPEGFDLGTVGVITAQGESLPVRGVPARHSGASPKPIAGECGQSTFGGLATAFNDANQLIYPRSQQQHLVKMVSEAGSPH